MDTLRATLSFMIFFILRNVIGPRKDATTGYKFGMLRDPFIIFSI